MGRNLLKIKLKDYMSSCLKQKENERSNRQMQEMEEAHKANLAQFQAKARAEQKAEIADLKRQMENDRREVTWSLNNKVNIFNST
jgi:hypothetical protein